MLYQASCLLLRVFFITCLAIIGLALHSLLLSHVGVTVRSSPNVPLRVGDHATLMCTNDVGVPDLIEWRSVDGTVLALLH